MYIAKKKHKPKYKNVFVLVTRVGVVEIHKFIVPGHSYLLND